MQINISVNPTDVADVNAAIQFLNGLVPMDQRDAVRSPSTKPLGVVPVTALDDPSVGAEPEKRKPGRPKKEVPPAVEAAVEAVGKPEDSSSAPTTDSSAPATTTLTLDDVRSALQGYTRKHSIEAGIELLKKFDAQRVSELPADKYTDFVKECA